MKLSIQSLTDAGAFTGAPAEREITWKQGVKEYKATIFVKPLSFHSAVADVRTVRGDIDPIAARIASTICDDIGNFIFTPEDITGQADPSRGPLNANLTLALLGAIGEVNQLGK